MSDSSTGTTGSSDGDDTDTSYLGHTQLPDDSPDKEGDLALSEQAKRVQGQREHGGNEQESGQ